MSKARVAVLHVVSGQLTVTAAAKSMGCLASICIGC
jgi:hypothetical protein